MKLGFFLALTTMLCDPSGSQEHQCRRFPALGPTERDRFSASWSAVVRYRRNGWQIL